VGRIMRPEEETRPVWGGCVWGGRMEVGGNVKSYSRYVERYKWARSCRA
jgi:hypothetical protein